MQEEQFQTAVMNKFAELGELAAHQSGQIALLRKDYEDFKVLVTNKFTHTDEQITSLRKDHEHFKELIIGQFSVMNNHMLFVQTELRDVKEELKGVKQEIKGLTKDVRTIEIQVMDIHQARNNVKMKFGLEWAMASFLIALVAAGLSQFIAMNIGR